MGELGIGQVRIANNQRIAGIAFGISGSQQHRASLTARKKFSVLRISEKTQLIRTSLLQGGQTADRVICSATQGGAQTLGQLAKGINRGTHDQRSLFIRSIT